MEPIFAFRIERFPMRKPNVYFFNPTCELAVANGSFSYMPPLLLREMENDLSILPVVFCSENDFVLTENAPSPEFLLELRKAGFEIPGFFSLSDLEAMPDGSFGAVYPWGWSPAAHFKLKNLKTKCSEEFKKSPVYNWTADHQLLFERMTSLGFLNEILGRNQLTWFVDKGMTGVKISNPEEIEPLLNQYSSVVLKAPLSSSGRGIQVIRRKFLNSSNKQWISGVLKQQGYLIAEPFLEKVLDLSFQFRILTGSEVSYLGYSVFETNTNGQYSGTLIHPDLNTVLSGEDIKEVKEMIGVTAEVVHEALKNAPYTSHYRGFMGVDAMIFRNGGRLMMQPCIEVNCRMNMGVLAMFLENKIHPDATGKFELFYGNPGEYRIYAADQLVQNQSEKRDGKLYAGFLPVTEPDSARRFGAYASLGTAKY